MASNRDDIRLKTRMPDREFDREFNDVVERARSLSENIQPFSSSELGREQRMARAESDINYFAKTYMPHYFTDEWAPVQEKVWPVIASTCGIPQVLEAPREVGKSAYMGVMNALHSIVYMKRHYLISVGYTTDKAKMTTMFVLIELMHNPRLKADFGALMDGAPVAAYDFFVTKTDICMQAVSTMQDPRGIRWRQHRPDWVVLDDVQEKRRVRGPRGRQYVRKSVEWIMEDLIPALAQGYWFCLLGTPLAGKCVVRTLGSVWSANYHHQPAIKGGRLLFPQRWPQERLDSTKETIGRKAYNQEILLVIEDDDSFITEEKIAKYHPEEILNLSGFTVSWFDPSAKASEIHCYKAIITLTMIGGVAYVRDAWIRHATMDAAIRHHFTLYQELLHNAMYYEDNGGQSHIQDTLNRDCRDMGIQLPIKGMANVENKILRINQTLQAPLERGLIKFNPAQGDQQLLIEHLIDFPAEFVDGPDALEGAYRMGLKHTVRRGNWRASRVG